MPCEALLSFLLPRAGPQTRRAPGADLRPRRRSILPVGGDVHASGRTAAQQCLTCMSYPIRPPPPSNALACLRTQDTRPDEPSRVQLPRRPVRNQGCLLLAFLAQDRFVDLRGVGLRKPSLAQEFSPGLRQSEQPFFPCGLDIPHGRKMRECRRTARR